ncbi:MAG: 5-formyltetrahydrofolate cyclo-ligase [Verrucomicrobiales bacterium]|jgi:5-formyltetrahydrofolate cyclo-ligase|nr:5-formyltetrahydrofolate cyclo-ligase [Verrucomicrobiales bacterium]
MNIAAQKQALRRELREKLRLVSDDERAAASRRIVAKIFSLPAWRAARTVLLFAPLTVEPDISPLLMTARAAGKRVFYPRVTGSDLEICEVRGPEDVRAGAFGVLEPVTVAASPLTVPDLALVPGLGFDADGHRLGRGRGYYDRFLSTTRTLTVGVGFHCQRVEKIPAEPHDVRLDMVVTEE